MTAGDATPGTRFGQQPVPLNAPPAQQLGIGVQPGVPNIIRARLVIISGANGGLFIYSGTPAAGNLIASIAAAPGTDPYGNAYLDGVVTYGTGTPPNSFTQDRGGQIFWGDTGTGAQVAVNAVIQLNDPAVVTASPALEILSPETAAGTLSALMVAGQSQNLSQPALVQVQPYLVPAQPGTGPGGFNPEVWHSLTLTGWTGTFKYRLTAENEVQLSWQLTAPAAGVNNTTFATLPVGYRPTTTRTFPTASDSVTASTMGLMFVQSTGVIQVNHIIASATNVSGEVRFPLGL